MTLSVDPGSGVPIHVQVSSQIRQRIASGALLPGDRMPPEEQLARSLGISRSTMRQALATLVSEGLLSRKAGDGTRVASPPTTEMGFGAWSSFSSDLAAQGITVQTFSHEVSVIPADHEVARGLGIELETPVVFLDRVRGYDELPAVWFRSWFHPRLGLDANATFDGPLYRFLEERCGVTAAVSREEISAVKADTVQAQRLEVEAGDALMVRRRIVTDAAGHVLEYACNWYRPDRFTYTLVMNRQAEGNAR